jgi:hypothetical protein
MNTARMTVHSKRVRMRLIGTTRYQGKGENLLLIVYFPGPTNSNARIQAGLAALFLSSGDGIHQRVNTYAAAL